MRPGSHNTKLSLELELGLLSNRGFDSVDTLYLYPKPAVRDNGYGMTRSRPHTQMLIKYLATGVVCVCH